MESREKKWLEALASHGAVAIGPIARLLVERAAASAVSFDDIRRQVADQLNGDARERFLQATEALATEARANFRVSAQRASHDAAGDTGETVDRSDPEFVRALIQELIPRLGPNAEAAVTKAARRCRTKMQLCLLLGETVGDPELTARLAKYSIESARRRRSQSD